MKKLFFSIIFIIIIIMVINYMKFNKSYDKFHLNYDMNTIKYEKVCKSACNEWNNYIDVDKDIKINIYNNIKSENVMATSSINSNNVSCITINSNIFDKYNLEKQVQTIKHEIGHILGIGTHKLWLDNTKNNKLYLDNLPNCKLNYNKVQSDLLGKECDFDFIPLTDSSKGKSSCDKHWCDIDIYDKEKKIIRYGMSNEIMCHHIKGEGYISKITIGFLQDIGFKIKDFDNYLFTPKN